MLKSWSKTLHNFYGVVCFPNVAKYWFGMLGSSAAGVLILVVSEYRYFNVNNE